MSPAVVQLPESETPIELFNGVDLAGWSGLANRWSVEDRCIVGRNEDEVPTSTYLFSDDSYREFRLLLDVKQTRSPRHSKMHSAVAALGERFNDQGNEYGFRGPLLMFCYDWGIWDAYRRDRVEPAGLEVMWRPEGIERVGEWNAIEILVLGDRIRFAANGKLVFDFTDEPEMLQTSPIALQLHSNDRPQEFFFKNIVLTECPEDRLITLSDA